MRISDWSSDVCSSDLMLGGCMMGPNFHGAPPPPASMSKTFVRADQAALPVPPQLTPWWRALNDPLLDQLITRALSSNPSLEVAEARVRQARSRMRGARAALVPVVGAGARAGRNKAPGLVRGGCAKRLPPFLGGLAALGGIGFW